MMGSSGKNPRADAQELAVIAVEIHGMVLKALRKANGHERAEPGGSEDMVAATLAAAIINTLSMNDHAQKTRLI